MCCRYLHSLYGEVKIAAVVESCMEVQSVSKVTYFFPADPPLHTCAKFCSATNDRPQNIRE